MTQRPDVAPLSQQQRGQLTQTDERAPNIIDIPEAPADHARFARRGLEPPRTSIRLQRDPDVLAWPQKRGAADQTHINALLRDRMRSEHDSEARN